MRTILALPLALVIILSSPLLAYAQNPFTFGNTNNPFSNGGGSAQSNGNVTLQIRSDTDWSGSYGSTTGSTSIDGHGNRDISFGCSGTYSAFFQKKSSGHGILTLNIVQNVTNPKWIYASDHPPLRVYKNQEAEDANVTQYGMNAIYDYNAIKGIPENISNITNSKTTTAGFGTVSVMGNC